MLKQPLLLFSLMHELSCSFFCNIFILQDILITSSMLEKAVENRNINGTNSILGDKDDEKKKSHSGKN